MRLGSLYVALLLVPAVYGAFFDCSFNSVSQPNGVFSVVLNTTGVATLDLDDTCGVAVQGGGGFVSFPGDGLMYNITSYGSEIATYVHVYRTHVDGGTLCDSVCVDRSTDGVLTSSPAYGTLLLPTEPSFTYHVLVSGRAGAEGLVSASSVVAVLPAYCDGAVVLPHINNITVKGVTVDNFVVGVNGSGVDVCSEPDLFGYDEPVCEGPAAKFIFAGNGDYVTISSCGSDFDTKLSVSYQQNGGCGGECVGYNDDAFEVGCVFQSELSFHTSRDTNYTITLCGYAGDSGNYTLTVWSEAPECDDVTPLALPGYQLTKLSTQSSVSPASEPCVDDDGVAYCSANTERVEVDGTGGVVAVATCNSNVNTFVTVSASNGDNCSDSCVAVAKDDTLELCRTTDSTRASLSFPTELGEKYYVSVCSEDTVTAKARANIIVNELTPLTCNEYATELSGSLPLVVSSTTAQKPSLVGHAFTCDNGDAVYDSSRMVMFKYLANETSTLVASTCFSVTAFDSQVFVFEGDNADCGAVCIDSSDDDIGCLDGAHGTVSFSATAGSYYYILVAGKKGVSGKFTLSLTRGIDYVCPQVETAEPVIDVPDSLPWTHTATLTDNAPLYTEKGNLFQKAEVLPFCGFAYQAGSAQWFNYTRTSASEWVLINTCGSDFLTGISIYNSSSSVAGGGCLECVEGVGSAASYACAFGANADTGGGAVAFYAEQGATYYILLAAADPNVLGSGVYEFEVRSLVGDADTYYVGEEVNENGREWSDAAVLAAHNGTGYVFDPQASSTTYFSSELQNGVDGPMGHDSYEVPVTRHTASIPSGGTPVLYHQALVATDEAIYSYGGTANSEWYPLKLCGSSFSKLAWRFDLTSATWTRIADLPVGLSQHAFTETGGYLYTHGGLTKGTGTSKCPSSTGDMYRYEIATDTWSLVSYAESSPLPKKRASHSLSANQGDGAMWMFGGYEARQGNVVRFHTEVWVYYIDAGMWFERNAYALDAGDIIKPQIHAYGLFVFMFGGYRVHFYDISYDTAYTSALLAHSLAATAPGWMSLPDAFQFPSPGYGCESGSAVTVCVSEDGQTSRMSSRNSVLTTINGVRSVVALTDNGFSSITVHCPAGFYITPDGDCEACEAGHISISPDVSVCTPCLDGFEPDPSSTSCNACATGSVSTGVECTVCERGYYSSANKSVCIACPAGQFSSSTGQSTCEECGAGTYSTGGSRSCTSCPVARYQPNAGQSTCKRCASGAYTDATGSTTIKDCRCLGDMYGLDECKKCPEGGDCSRHGPLPDVKEGYYRAPDDPETIVRCYPPNSCKGDTNAFRGGYADNITLCKSPYTGYMCGGCEDEYSKYGDECVECRSWYFLPLFILMIACYSLAVMLSPFFRLSRMLSDLVVVSITLDFLQTIAVIGKMRLKWSSQVLYFLTPLGFFNLDLQLVGCGSYISKWRMQMALPVFALVFLVALGLIIYAVLHIAPTLIPAHVSRDELHQTLTLQVCHGFLYFSNAMFLIIVVRAVEALHCRQVGADYVLSAQPDILCSGSVWRGSLLPGSVVASIAYVVGVPATYLCVYNYIHKKALLSKFWSEHTAWRYTRAEARFELVNIARRLVIGMSVHVTSTPEWSALMSLMAVLILGVIAVDYMMPYYRNSANIVAILQQFLNVVCLSVGFLFLAGLFRNQSTAEALVYVAFAIGSSVLLFYIAIHAYIDGKVSDEQFETLSFLCKDILREKRTQLNRFLPRMKVREVELATEVMTNLSAAKTVQDAEFALTKAVRRAAIFDILNIKTAEASDYGISSEWRSESGEGEGGEFDAYSEGDDVAGGSRKGVNTGKAASELEGTFEMPRKVVSLTTSSSVSVSSDT